MTNVKQSQNSIINDENKEVCAEKTERSIEKLKIIESMTYTN